MRQHQFERICDQIMEEKRWRRFKDRRINITPSGFPVRAHLSLNDRRIQLTFSRRFEPLVQSMIQKHKLSVDAESACEAIVYHLLVHEFNHHHYCPHSVFLFEQIINGIRRVVEKKEIRESNIRRVCLEIHNMFSDTVINAIESQSDQSKRYRFGAGSGAAPGAFLPVANKVVRKKRQGNEAVPQVKHAPQRHQRRDIRTGPTLPAEPAEVLLESDRIVRDIIELFLQEPALVERP